MEGHELPKVSWWCENCSTVFANTNDTAKWARPVARYFLEGGRECERSSNVDNAKPSTAA